jgi:hypothetical protein
VQLVNNDIAFAVGSFDRKRQRGAPTIDGRAVNFPEKARQPSVARLWISCDKNPTHLVNPFMIVATATAIKIRKKTAAQKPAATRWRKVGGAGAGKDGIRL